MSTTGPQGFPDFQRFTQVSSGAIVHAVNQPLTTLTALGPFYVGYAESLLVRNGYTTEGGSFLDITCQFYNDQAKTQLTGFVSTQGDISGQINDVLPVLGNWVSVVVSSNLFDPVFQQYFVDIVPLAYLPNESAVQQGIGALVLASLGGVAGGGGTAQAQAQTSQGGRATLCVVSTLPNWTVDLRTIWTPGGVFPIAHFDTAAGQLGVTLPVTLPRTPVNVVVTNNNAAAANFTVALTTAP